MVALHGNFLSKSRYACGFFLQEDNIASSERGEIMNLGILVRLEYKLKTFVRKLLNKHRVTTYLRSDRRPWSYGYSEYKEQYLHAAINNLDLARNFQERNGLPDGYGFRMDERVIEIPWALAHMANQSGRLLDAGSALNHEYVLKSNALTDFNKTIVTLAPESVAYPNLSVSYVYGDLRDLGFRDEWFDVITCISTIEHIGMDNSMYIKGFAPSAIDVDSSGGTNGFRQTISELKRVLKPGGILYITFPFGKHENHGFFQQFDTQLTDLLIKSFAPTHIAETVFRYDPDGWVLSDRDACEQCEYFDVHKSKYFDPNSKIEYPSDYTAGVRAVACLELKK